MEDPEYQESERIGPLIVKTVVLSYLDDPVEEVAGQPDAPEDNAGGNGNLPPVVGDAEVITRAYEEAQDSQDHKVCPSSKVCHLKPLLYLIFFELKELTLSNLRVAATKKKENCIPTVTRAQSARLLVSLSQMIITTTLLDY